MTISACSVVSVSCPGCSGVPNDALQQLNFQNGLMHISSGHKHSSQRSSPVGAFKNFHCYTHTIQMVNTLFIKFMLAMISFQKLRPDRVCA